MHEMTVLSIMMIDKRFGEIPDDFDFNQSLHANRSTIEQTHTSSLPIDFLTHLIARENQSIAISMKLLFLRSKMSCVNKLQ